MKIKRAIIITVLLLPLALTFSNASAGDTNWDKEFSKPQYLVHVVPTYTELGGYFLYDTPPQNGVERVPTSSISWTNVSTDYSSGPLMTPRQVCDAAQARGVGNQIFSHRGDPMGAFDCSQLNGGGAANPPTNPQPPAALQGGKPRFNDSEKKKFEEYSNILLKRASIWYVFFFALEMKYEKLIKLSASANDSYSRDIYEFEIKDVEEQESGLELVVAYYVQYAALAGRLANDPPDPNFKVIAQPAAPPLQPVTAQGNFTQQLADAWNALLNNQTQSAGVARALLTSVERAQGAFDAGDTNWQTKQMEAAAQYSSQSATLLNAEPALRTNLKNAWQAAGLSDITVTPDDIRKSQADVAANGLPPDLVNNLTRLGADSATIEMVRQNYIAQDPNKVAGSFLGSLTDPALDSATRGSAQALNEFAASNLPSPLQPTPVTPTVSKQCEGTTPYLYIEDRTMDTGKTVEILVMMCNAENLANMDLTLNYDTSILKIQDITKGSLNANAIFDWNEVSPGRIKTSFASKEGASGSGSIALMTFDVIGNTGTTALIGGTVTTASNIDGTTISVNVVPGTFTVGTSTLKGDCDGDGKLDEREVLAALQMSVGKKAVDMCYDYNKDGKVDSSDAREMLIAIVSGG